MLDFDFAPADPTVTFRAIAADGTEIHTFTLARSALEGNGVYVSAVDSDASESGDAASFRVGRSQVSASPLDVSLSVSGTATEGDDFTVLPRTVPIPANDAYTTVTITPLDDTLVEDGETVVITVEPTVPSTYVIGRPATATLTIADDEALPLLVLHYRLDETSETVASDSSTRGLDGAVHSDTAPVWTTGAVEGALQFAETEHVYVDAGDPAGGELDFGTDQDFTIAAWVKVSTLPADQYTIVGKGDGGGNPRLLLKINPAGVVFFTVRDTDMTGSTNVADGQWHHIAATCDRDGQANIYVDATLDATGGVTTAQDISSTSPFLVGKSGNDRRYMDGLIDEVKVFTEALDAAAVTVLKNMGPSPTIASVIPSSGAAAGGTSVTVTGANFVAGATVRFGANPGTNTNVADATSITTDTPPGAGTVDVTVTNPDTQSATLAEAFTYDAPPPADTSLGCAPGVGHPLPAALALAAVVAALLVVRTTARKNA